MKEFATVHALPTGNVHFLTLLILTPVYVNAEKLEIVFNHISGMIKNATVLVLNKNVLYLKYLTRIYVAVLAHQTRLAHLHGLLIKNLVNVFVDKKWNVHYRMYGIVKIVIAHALNKIAYYPRY